MQSYSLPDKLDKWEFTGALIGEASTETPQAVRWTEIELYKTEGGHYVIHRIGRSVLYHRHDSACNTGVARRVDELDPEFDYQPCLRCCPRELDQLNDGDLVDEELDKHSVDVCEAEEVYDRLLLKRDGTSFMSNPARRAMEMAIKIDPELGARIGKVRRVS